MQSTFSGIELGKRGLTAHTLGLQTTGHNLSNASTEGYSRQRVEMKATDPLYVPGLNREETPGQVGQGTNVAAIRRVRDEILEGRIVAQAEGEGYWAARDRYLNMLEKIYNEPSEVSVRAKMDRFWSGWQELSLHPSEMAARSEALERGKALIDGIHERYYGLKRIRDMAEEEIQVKVGEVNALTRDIAALNEEILKVKAMGDSPNDLMDRRDLLVGRLSGLINITVDKRDPDEFVIHTAGFHIVQGKNHRSLGVEGNPDNDGYSRVFWDRGGEDFHARGGSLAAILEIRDGDLRREIQNLDSMTINFIDLVNEIHRSAYGLNERTGNDFFVEYPAINNMMGNYDRNGDGDYDSSYIFRVSGANSLQPQEQIGLAGEMVFEGPRGEVRIPYHPADTVENLVIRINNSEAEISARLDRQGRLSLKAGAAEDPAFPDFVIRRIEDSGQFLTGYAGILLNSGPQGAFQWNVPDAVTSLRGGDLDYAVAPLAHPAAWIEVNRELDREPASIAAAFGEAGRPGRPGDGSAALAVASLRNHDVMIGKTTTFDGYFAEVVAEVGLKGERAEIALATQERIMKDLRDMRESISGVNIDEELSNMIKYQHGYAAVARFISEFTKMIDTIINRVGV